MRKLLAIFICLMFGLIIISCGNVGNKKQDASGLPDIIKHSNQISKHVVLENGLELLIVENHVVPNVSILAAVKNGALAESPEYNGLSHLYEHMFFKGNKNLPNQELYMKRMRELGMVFNGTTSTEAVQYFFTLPSKNFEAGLEFMKDALMSPIFDEQELEREKAVVLSEYDRAESSPYYYLRESITNKLFYAHPSRKNVLGKRAIISSASRKKMQTIKHRYYVPNNTMLIISGDVDRNEAVKLVKEYYLSWPKAKNPYDEHPVPEHPPLTESKTIVVKRPFQNVLIQYTWQGPSVDKDRDATYAADVLSFLFDLRSSKFSKNLVDSGILHTANFAYLTQRHTGPIYLMGLSSPENGKLAIEALKAEVEKFVEPDYITDEELENAKFQIAVGMVHEAQYALSVAKSFGFWWCVADLDYKLSYLDKLNQVTRKDIVAFVKKYVIGKPYVLGILVSEENAKKLELPSDTTEKEVTK